MFARVGAVSDGVPRRRASGRAGACARAAAIPRARAAAFQRGRRVPPRQHATLGPAAGRQHRECSIHYILVL